MPAMRMDFGRRMKTVTVIKATTERGIWIMHPRIVDWLPSLPAYPP